MRHPGPRPPVGGGPPRAPTGTRPNRRPAGAKHRQGTRARRRSPRARWRGPPTVHPVPAPRPGDPEPAPGPAQSADARDATRVSEGCGVPSRGRPQPVASSADHAGARAPPAPTAAAQRRPSAITGGTSAKRTPPLAYRIATVPRSYQAAPHGLGGGDIGVVRGAGAHPARAGAPTSSAWPPCVPGRTGRDPPPSPRGPVTLGGSRGRRPPTAPRWTLPRAPGRGARAARRTRWLGPHPAQPRRPVPDLAVIGPTEWRGRQRTARGAAVSVAPFPNGRQPPPAEHLQIPRPAPNELDLDPEGQILPGHGARPHPEPVRRGRLPGPGVPMRADGA